MEYRLFSQNIDKDHQRFKKVIEGKLQKRMKQFADIGSIFRLRAKGGVIRVNLPKISPPHFVYGKSKKGIGRGEGKIGDVIDKDKEKGKKGSGASDEHAEGMLVDIDVKDVLKYMQEELKLPNMLPKPSETFEEIKKKWTNISRNGPASLRHMKRSFQQMLKRSAAQGTIGKMIQIPGFSCPMPATSLIGDDIRYRQYDEIKIPTSEAVIFFARDCSGSMDEFRCNIVSDMAYWIELWISEFYDKTERCYIIHDTEAEEVGSEKFYNYRYGGGTMCSSAFRKIAELLENKYPPQRYNVYIFYFTDGDNWGDDNKIVCNIIKNELSPKVVNLIGITEVLPYGDGDRLLKSYVDKQLTKGKLDSKYVRTTNITVEDNMKNQSWGWNGEVLTDEERNKKTKDAILELLGTNGKKSVTLREVASNI